MSEFKKNNIPQYSQNRSIKTQRVIKTKLLLIFCMNSFTIMIGQLRLDFLTNRKTRKKDKNKRNSKLLLIIYQ